MSSLKEFVSQFKDIVSIANILKREFEVTKILRNYEPRIVVFRTSHSSFQCVGNVFASREALYRILGVSDDIEAYKKILYAESHPSRPIEVSFEDYFKEVEVDLNQIPFVKFYPEDGGYYTSASIIVSCIDGICNSSIHRVMFIDKSSVVARIVPRHLRKIYDMYRSRNMYTPIAIAIGVPPIALLASALSPPFGIFEFDVVSRIRPLKIAFTPKYKIPVPVPSAIVLEGVITDTLVREGPFVDILSLYDRQRYEPLIKIERMYVNYDEYFHIILPGGKEHKLLQSFYREVKIFDAVSRVVPRVCKIRLTEGSGSWLHAVMSIEKLHEGDSKNALLAAFAAHPSLKVVTVVDCDIDVDNPVEVEWAVMTRARFSKDIVLIRDARCSTLDPSSDDGLCDKLGIDATIPLDRDRKLFIKASIGSD